METINSIIDGVIVGNVVCHNKFKKYVMSLSSGHQWSISLSNNYFLSADDPANSKQIQRFQFSIA